MTPKLIVAKDIIKSYQKEQILRGLSLEVEESEFLAIIGASGSGKSTLLHILGGMDNCDAGEVSFDGENMCKMSSRELAQLRNREFGFVFQFFYLEPHLTVAENLEIPCFLTKLNKTERKKRVQNVATLVSIEGLLDKYPRQLSGGEQQRVAIGRAIMNHPRVLFLDEPTGNLDTKNTVKVMDLLKTLQVQNGFTIVMITHDMAVANVANRVVKMMDGKIC